MILKTILHISFIYILYYEILKFQQNFPHFTKMMISYVSKQVKNMNQIPSTVKMLDLTKNNVTILDLTEFKQLEILNASNNPIEKIILNQSLKSLIIKMLLSQQIEFVNNYGYKQQLTTLVLQNCNIHNFGQIPNFEYLQLLDLSNNVIDSFINLNQYKQLRTFNFFNNKQLMQVLLNETTRSQIQNLMGYYFQQLKTLNNQKFINMSQHSSFDCVKFLLPTTMFQLDQKTNYHESHVLDPHYYTNYYVDTQQILQNVTQIPVFGENVQTAVLLIRRKNEYRVVKISKNVKLQNLTLYKISFDDEDLKTDDENEQQEEKNIEQSLAQIAKKKSKKVIKQQQLYFNSQMKVKIEGNLQNIYQLNIFYIDYDNDQQVSKQKQMNNQTQQALLQTDASRTLDFETQSITRASQQDTQNEPQTIDNNESFITTINIQDAISQYQANIDNDDNQTYKKDSQFNQRQKQYLENKQTFVFFLELNNINYVNKYIKIQIVTYQQQTFQQLTNTQVQLFNVQDMQLQMVNYQTNKIYVSYNLEYFTFLKNQLQYTNNKLQLQYLIYQYFYFDNLQQKININTVNQSTQNLQINDIDKQINKDDAILHCAVSIVLLNFTTNILQVIHLTNVTCQLDRYFDYKKIGAIELHEELPFTEELIVGNTISAQLTLSTYLKNNFYYIKNSDIELLIQTFGDKFIEILEKDFLYRQVNEQYYHEYYAILNLHKYNTQLNNTSDQSMKDLNQSILFNTQLGQQTLTQTVFESLMNNDNYIVIKLNYINDKEQLKITPNLINTILVCEYQNQQTSQSAIVNNTNNNYEQQLRQSHCGAARKLVFGNQIVQDSQQVQLLDIQIFNNQQDYEFIFSFSKIMNNLAIVVYKYYLYDRFNNEKLFMTQQFNKSDISYLELYTAYQKLRNNIQLESENSSNDDQQESDQNNNLTDEVQLSNKQLEYFIKQLTINAESEYKLVFELQATRKDGMQTDIYQIDGEQITFQNVLTENTVKNTEEVQDHTISFNIYQMLNFSDKPETYLNIINNNQLQQIIEKKQQMFVYDNQQLQSTSFQLVTKLQGSKSIQTQYQIVENTSSGDLFQIQTNNCNSVLQQNSTYYPMVQENAEQLVVSVKGNLCVDNQIQLIFNQSKLAKEIDNFSFFGFARADNSPGFKKQLTSTEVNEDDNLVNVDIDQLITSESPDYLQHIKDILQQLILSDNIQQQNTQIKTKEYQEMKNQINILNLSTETFYILTPNDAQQTIYFYYYNTNNKNMELYQFINKVHFANNSLVQQISVDTVSISIEQFNDENQDMDNTEEVQEQEVKNEQPQYQLNVQVYTQNNQLKQQIFNNKNTIFNQVSNNQQEDDNLSYVIQCYTSSYNTPHVFNFKSQQQTTFRLDKKKDNYLKIMILWPDLSYDKVYCCQIFQEIKYQELTNELLTQQLDNTTYDTFVQQQKLLDQLNQLNIQPYNKTICNDEQFMFTFFSLTQIKKVYMFRVSKNNLQLIRPLKVYLKHINQHNNIAEYFCVYKTSIYDCGFQLLAQVIQQDNIIQFHMISQFQRIKYHQNFLRLLQTIEERYKIALRDGISTNSKTVFQHKIFVQNKLGQVKFMSDNTLVFLIFNEPAITISINQYTQIQLQVGNKILINNYLQIKYDDVLNCGVFYHFLLYVIQFQQENNYFQKVNSLLDQQQKDTNRNADASGIHNPLMNINTDPKNDQVNHELNMFIQQEDMDYWNQNGVQFQYLISLQIIDQQTTTKLQTNQQLVFFLQQEYIQQTLNEQFYDLNSTLLHRQYKINSKQQQLLLHRQTNQLEYLINIFDCGYYLALYNKVMDQKVILGRIQLNTLILKQFKEMEQSGLIDLNYVCRSMNGQMLKLHIYQVLNKHNQKENFIILEDQLNNQLFKYKQPSNIKILLLQVDKPGLMLQMINCDSNNQATIRMEDEDQLEEVYIVLSYIGV